MYDAKGSRASYASRRSGRSGSAELAVRQHDLPDEDHVPVVELRRRLRTGR